MFSCPICGSKETKKRLKIKDFSVSKETFFVWLCKNCDVSFSTPYMSKKNLLNYYDQKNYPSFGFKSFSVFGFFYNLTRFFNTKYKFKQIKPLVFSSLLDYGSGNGYFSKYCRKIGIQAYDYEPINNSLSSKNQINDLMSFSIKNNPFSVITLWHVLEHTNSPKKTLLNLKKILHVKGHIIVALPNKNSYDSIYYKNYWAGYDVPRHRFHFNPLSFVVLCKLCGFSIVKSFPLFFDVFYVSYLSEKYKKNSFSFLKGFIIGLLSNKFAKRSRNYSSLVYILKLK